MGGSMRLHAHRSLLTAFAAVSLCCSSSAAQDRAEIIRLNEYVPLALKAEGFDRYAALFHADYTNWSMSGTKPLTRAEFLAAVERWFDAGNYATESEVVPVSLELFGDFAYLRHFQKEVFMAPDGKRSAFVGEFASVLKKQDGRWLFYSTSFHTTYRGPVEGAPALPDPPPLAEAAGSPLLGSP